MARCGACGRFAPNQGCQCGATVAVAQPVRCAVLDRYERVHQGELDSDDAPSMSQEELREFLSDPVLVKDVFARAMKGDTAAMMTALDAVFALGDRERMRPEPRLRGIRYRQPPRRRRM